MAWIVRQENDELGEVFDIPDSLALLREALA